MGVDNDGGIMNFASSVADNDFLGGAENCDKERPEKEKQAKQVSSMSHQPSLRRKIL